MFGNEMKRVIKNNVKYAKIERVAANILYIKLIKYDSIGRVTVAAISMLFVHSWCTVSLFLTIMPFGK